MSDTHHVHLFDDLGSFVAIAGPFVADGVRARETVLLILDPVHWQALAEQLTSVGLEPERLVIAGQLVLRPARAVLRALTRHGRPDAERFEQVVGSLVSALGTEGRRVRIYNELCDLLAAQGDQTAIRDVERLWNQLAASGPEVCCGCSAVHFGNARTAGALSDLCHAHARTLVHPRDQLTPFLLKAACCTDARSWSSANDEAVAS